jgi:FKBP-type peptidyl-prolyl cis-trans isomerase FkpA
VRLSRVLSSTIAVAALAVLPLAGIACENDVTAPSDYSPFTKTDLRLGSGDEAVTGRTVTVEYTAWLYDHANGEKKGLVIDTSTGRAPFVFTLGAGAVIVGWDVGVPGMKVGGLRRLVVPPSMAYGPNRYSAIPPNSTLVFEIELLSVQDPS